jgi:hypothetical protein
LPTGTGSPFLAIENSLANTPRRNASAGERITAAATRSWSASSEASASIRTCTATGSAPPIMSPRMAEPSIV